MQNCNLDPNPGGTVWVTRLNMALFQNERLSTVINYGRRKLLFVCFSKETFCMCVVCGLHGDADEQHVCFLLSSRCFLAHSCIAGLQRKPVRSWHQFDHTCWCAPLRWRCCGGTTGRCAASPAEQAGGWRWRLRHRIHILLAAGRLLGHRSHLWFVFSGCYCAVQPLYF